MSRQDFTFYYLIGTTAPDSTTIYPAANAFLSNLQDLRDSTPNSGATLVGDDMFWSGSGRVQLIGFTGAGDPIILSGGEYWVLSDNGSLGGSVISPVFSGTYTYCFAAGTHFGTPGGPTPVEALEIGDLVANDMGGWVPVKWVGRQTVNAWAHGPRMQPVRIGAGALGGGLPHQDLTVTADHGMLLEGLMINASALVNGQTIDWVPMAELGKSFTVYHIETEGHEVILANGAPAETFIDVASRRNFDNYAEYLDLYGHERIIPALPLPRISSARLVPPTVQAQLNLRNPRANVIHDARRPATIGLP